MRIKIISENGVSDHAAFMLANGMPLENIAAVDIRLRPGAVVEAEMRFLLPGVDVEAEVTVTEAHLHELATAHGYALTKKATQ